MDSFWETTLDGTDLRIYALTLCEELDELISKNNVPPAKEQEFVLDHFIPTVEAMNSVVGAWVIQSSKQPVQLRKPRHLLKPRVPSHVAMWNIMRMIHGSWVHGGLVFNYWNRFQHDEYLLLKDEEAVDKALKEVRRKDADGGGDSALDDLVRYNPDVW